MLCAVRAQPAEVACREARLSCAVPGSTVLSAGFLCQNFETFSQATIGPDKLSVDHCCRGCGAQKEARPSHLPSSSQGAGSSARKVWHSQLCMKAAQVQNAQERCWVCHAQLNVNSMVFLHDKLGF